MHERNSTQSSDAICPYSPIATSRAAHAVRRITERTKGVQRVQMRARVSVPFIVWYLSLSLSLSLSLFLSRRRSAQGLLGPCVRRYPHYIHSLSLCFFASLQLSAGLCSCTRNSYLRAQRRAPVWNLKFDGKWVSRKVCLLYCRLLFGASGASVCPFYTAPYFFPLTSLTEYFLK